MFIESIFFAYVALPDLHINLLYNKPFPTSYIVLSAFFSSVVYGGMLMFVFSTCCVVAGCLPFYIFRRLCYVLFVDNDGMSMKCI